MSFGVWGGTNNCYEVQGVKLDTKWPIVRWIQNGRIYWTQNGGTLALMHATRHGCRHGVDYAT